MFMMHRLVHERNASFPIELTLSPIETDKSEENDLNEDAAISVTELPIVISLTPVYVGNIVLKLDTQ